MKSNIVLFLLCVFPAVLPCRGAGPADAAVPPPPDGFLVCAPGNGDGTTWRHCGTLPLTYAAAKRNFDLYLRKLGWTKDQTVEFDRIHWKSLELWSNGRKMLLVQYWREGPALTGISWGIMGDDRS